MAFAAIIDAREDVKGRLSTLKEALRILREREAKEAEAKAAADRAAEDRRLVPVAAGVR